MFKIINQLFKIEKKRISILFLMMFIAGFLRDKIEIQKSQQVKIRYQEWGQIAAVGLVGLKTGLVEPARKTSRTR